MTGAFSMMIPKNGRYVVKAEFAAFAAVTQEVLINAAGLNGGKPAQVADFGLQLASRVAAEEAQQASAASIVSGAVARGLQSLNVQRGGLDSHRRQPWRRQCRSRASLSRNRRRSRQRLRDGQRCRRPDQRPR